jgi:hypothetical protein
LSLLLPIPEKIFLKENVAIISLRSPAGADIVEMSETQFVQNYKTNFLAHWTDITKLRKPIIAAVQGFAVHFKSFALVVLK